MKKLLCVVCVLGGLHSAFALDRSAFTFTDYKLQVRVTPQAQSLQASGKLTLRNDTAQPQRNPVLQISSTLQWNTITIANKPVQYLAHVYSSDVDHTGALSEAVVSLPQPVPPQGTVEIEISYSGTITQDSTRLTRIGTPPEQAARSDWDQIGESFTGVRGAGYVAWYPIATPAASLSEPDAVFETVAAWKQRQARSAMQISLCGPGSLQLIANDQKGFSAASASGAAGTRCRDLLYSPLVMTVPTFILGSYQVLNQPPTAIQHLAGHESYARDWAADAEKIAPSLAQWFGPRKRAAQIVEMPGRDWYPYESGAMLFTPLPNENRQEVQIALAHELAHASFQSPRPWMDEGLAHFAQALEREQQEGRRAALAYMDRQLPPLQEAEKQSLGQAGGGRTPRGEPLVLTANEAFYRTKAMFVWWMLRDMVGDDALGHAIRAYRPEQDKEPSYFQRLLNEQFHRDLEWFFDDWVYRDRGLPDFQVTAVYPRRLLPEVPESWSVTVTVENLGGAAAEVPVIVRAAQGEEFKRAEIHAREKGVVHIPMPAKPVEAIVNDGSVPESNMNNNTAEITTTQSSQ